MNVAIRNGLANLLAVSVLEAQQAPQEAPCVFGRPTTVFAGQQIAAVYCAGDRTRNLDLVLVQPTEVFRDNQRFIAYEYFLPTTPISLRYRVFYKSDNINEPSLVPTYFQSGPDNAEFTLDEDGKIVCAEPLIGGYLAVSVPRCEAR